MGNPCVWFIEQYLHIPIILCGVGQVAQLCNTVRCDGAESTAGVIGRAERNGTGQVTTMALVTTTRARVYYPQQRHETTDRVDSVIDLKCTRIRRECGAIERVEHRQ